MDPVTTLPMLLGLAWLVPLASFALIVFFGPRMGKAGVGAGYVATGAILASCVLSLFAMFFVWLPSYDLPDASTPRLGRIARRGHECRSIARPTSKNTAKATPRLTTPLTATRGITTADTLHTPRSRPSPATGTRWGSSARCGSRSATTSIR